MLKIKILSILGLSTAAISLSAITPTLISSCSSNSEVNYRSKMFETSVQGLDAIVNAIFLDDYMKKAYNWNEIYNQIPKEVLRPKIFDLFHDPLYKSIIEIDTNKDGLYELFDFYDLKALLAETSRECGFSYDSGSFCVSNKQIIQKGWDKKTEITLEDFKRDFPNAIWIQGDAFENCSFTKIQIPETVLFLGGFSLKGCDEISCGLFENMWNTLTEVEIPVNNVLYYGPNCFKNCNQLKKLPISQKAIVLADQSFYGCKYDPIIKNLPDSIQYIGDKTFYNLENYDVNSNKPFPNNGRQEFNEFNFPASLKIFGFENFFYEKDWRPIEPNAKIFLNFSKNGNELTIGEKSFFIYKQNFNSGSVSSYNEFLTNCGLKKVIFSENNASLFLNYAYNKRGKFSEFSWPGQENIPVIFPDFVLNNFKFVRNESQLFLPDYSYTNPIFKKIIFTPQGCLQTKSTSNSDPISYIKPIDFSKFKYVMMNYNGIFEFNIYFWLYYANRKDNQIFSFDLANFLEQIQTDIINQKQTNLNMNGKFHLKFDIPSLNLLPPNGIEIVINKNKYFDAFIKKTAQYSKYCEGFFEINKTIWSDPEYDNYLRTKIKVKIIPEYKNLICVPTEVQIIDTV